MNALRAAVGTLVTLGAAVGYVHGIVWLQDWNDGRIQERAQEVVEQVVEPAEDTLGHLTTDKVSPPEPAWDLVCGENETANDDLTACIPLEPSLPATEPEPAIHEDDPRWDCAAMGNGTCGVGTEWHGLLVGDVIVCPAGLEVAIDHYPNGTTWAGCM
jgi:hypothetical protein